MAGHMIWRERIGTAFVALCAIWLVSVAMAVTVMVVRVAIGH